MPLPSSGSSDAVFRPRILRGRDFRHMFLRCLLMQGTWNPERMLHHGLLFAMLPGFRRIAGTAAEQQDLIRRHLAFFNTHPIFASFICGGVLRLEEQRLTDGSADIALVEKFKTRLSHLLGSMGDRFFWKLLRPCAVLCGVVCVLAATSPIWVIAAPVLVYNIPHLYFRWHGLTAGYRRGFDVLAELGVERFERCLHLLTGAVLLIIGIAVTMSIVYAGTLGTPALGAFFGAATGTVVLQRLRVRPLLALLAPMALAAAAGYWLIPECTQVQSLP